MDEIKTTIVYDDFLKLDIRVGTIVEAIAPEWSEKLLQFTVDFGSLGKRTIFSGIKKWYSPEDFIGKQFCFIVNLEPKKMGKAVSEGMMLMADTKENDDGTGKPTIIPLTTQVENGTIIR